MAFAIAYGVLVGTAVCHFPEDGTWFPSLIGQFLYGLYPVVGYVHRHAVVETIASVLKLSCQSGHSTHLFGNSYGVCVHLVYESVGESEIADGVVVLMSVEIIAIVAERLAQSVTVIKHRGNTVEAESVEMELLKPVLAVG